MRRNVSFALFLLCLALAASAEQPPRDSLTGKLFLLWSEVPPVTTFPIPRQGIYSYDVGTRIFTRTAPFGFLSDGYFGTQVALGATADRFIVEGTDYYEFDAASGRLLRRYRGLGTQFGQMRLHGAVVTEEQTEALGLKAGVYGFPDCSEAALDQMGCSNSAISALPGNPSPFDSLSRVLLRRPLTPGATALESIVPLPAPEGQHHTGVAFIALDPRERKLWLWHAVSSSSPTTVVQQLVWVRPGGDQQTVAREMVWDQSTSNSNRLFATQFTFHPALRSFFIKFESNNDRTWRFVRWPEDLSAEEVILSGKGDSTNIGAMAAMIEDLPPTYTQIVPLVRHADEASNHWRSEVWLFNPSEEAMNVTVRRVARQERTVFYTIAPHASLALPDVLKQLGGGATTDGGDGINSDALVITSSYRWGAQLAAYSRTDTVSEQPVDRGGTLGFTVPAVPGDVGYSTHTPLFQYGSFDTGGSQVSLILDKRDPDHFRHTIGVINDSDQSFEVRLRYASATASQEPEPIDRSFLAAAHSVTMRELESLFPTEFATDRPPRIWVSADRPAPIWMSMTDTRSGDMTFIPYSIFALRADPSTEIAAPAIGGGFGFPTVSPSPGRRRTASTTGSTAVPWRTDLYGFFLVVEGNEENQQPLTSFDPGTEQCVAASRRLSGVVGWNQPTEGVDPFWKTIFPDVAGQFSCAGSGTLRLRGASWMAGYARSYLTRANGGTVGDILPFYLTDGWPVQHFSGIKCDSKVQVTIGLYNGAAYPVTNRLLLYDANGQPLGQKDIVLPSRGSSQVNLSDLTPSCPSPGPYGLSVIPLDKPGQQGRSWAYVSILDNATGDPTILW